MIFKPFSTTTKLREFFMEFFFQISFSISLDRPQKLQFPGLSRRQLSQTILWANTFPNFQISPQTFPDQIYISVICLMFFFFMYLLFFSPQGSFQQFIVHPFEHTTM